MQNYREIDRVRKDSVAVRSLAKRPLAIPNHDWTGWEVDFLEGMTRHHGPDPLTTRQGEKLMELRDGLVWRETVYWAEPFTAPDWRSRWVDIPPAG